MATPTNPYFLNDISWKFALVLLTMSSWLPSVNPAATALTQYTMDQRSDCISAGFLDIPRDQVTKLTAPSKDTQTSTQVLSCRLQFSAETEGDTLRVTLDSSSYIEDCDVSLELQMMNSNSDKIIRGCKSGTSSVPALEAVNGQASIWLSRRLFGNTGFWFEVTVTAVRTEAAGISGNNSTADIGLIVGLTAAAIAVIIIVVIIVCCCRKKRQRQKEEEAFGGQNKSIVKSSQPTNTGHGYENNMAKISYDDSFQDTSKSKSALDRFGHTPAYRGQSNIESKQIETRVAEKSAERDFGRARLNKEHGETMDSRNNRVEKSVERDFGRARLNQEHGETMDSRNIRVEKAVRDAPADTNNTSPKSPMLAALHGNDKFRKSFTQNEIDAEERVRRVSDRSSVTLSSSGESENVAVRKPKSPSAPKKREKTSGAIRAARSSSSSSERTRHDSEDRDVKIKHASRPSDRKSKTSARQDNDKQNEDYADERRKREKDRKGENEDPSDGRRKREKDRKVGTKDKDEHKTKSEIDDKKLKRETGPGSIDDSDDRSQYREKEYEGRFKKSASGRKPKGKGQRMGRSRSTGNALEEMDSNYQSVRSKSPSSVRSLILPEDDDDNEELDSNYTSFKRSGSKTSLYASRSSLYGRRRKNSLGETMSMSSYMHDDMDSRMGDFERPYLSHREKERLFKSTGDLDLNSLPAVILRECATQTGNTKEVYVYGRRTVVSSRSHKLISRGTQTSAGKERRDSTGSARSGRSARSNRLKSRSKSQESLRKQKLSKSREFSDTDNTSEGSRHRRRRKHKDRDTDNASERSHSRRRAKSSNRDFSDSESKQSRPHSESSNDDDDDYSIKNSRRNKSMERDSDSLKQRHKSKAGKSRHTASHDFSDSDGDRSTVISSRAHSSIQQIGHIPHHPTGYPLAYPQPGMVYPQPGVAYVSTAPGGPPMMIPITSMPISTIPQKPSIAPKPNATKWDQLVNLTEGMKTRRHHMGESLDTESVLSSNWSQPVLYGNQFQTHHSPYDAVQRITTSSSQYGSTYPESVDVTRFPKERVIGYTRSYAPTDSNV